MSAVRWYVEVSDSTSNLSSSCILTSMTAAADFICSKFHESWGLLIIRDILNLYKRNCPSESKGNCIPIRGYIKMSNQPVSAPAKDLHGSGMRKFRQFCLSRSWFHEQRSLTRSIDYWRSLVKIWKRSVFYHIVRVHEKSDCRRNVRTNRTQKGMRLLSNWKSTAAIPRMPTQYSRRRSVQASFCDSSFAN